MLADRCLLLQFYLDDLEDELTITALRMLVKDLLILFQAGNEGVINVLGMNLSNAISIKLIISRELFRDVTRGCKRSTSIISPLLYAD